MMVFRIVGTVLLVPFIALMLVVLFFDRKHVENARMQSQL